MQTHTLINTALILIYVCWFMWKTTGMLNSLISKLQVIEDKLDKSNSSALYLRLGFLTRPDVLGDTAGFSTGSGFVGTELTTGG